MHILATDLDGTFLGGSDAARARLIDHFLAAPERRLLYVTGRSVNSVQGLIRDGRLPQPDGMICDVGTTVACGRGERLPGPAQEAVEAVWQDQTQTILELLDGHPGLNLQADFGPRRVSYTFEPGADLDTPAAKVRELGLTPLVSANVFFDVLPPGINKGVTLRRWLEQHGYQPQQALAAGDTLNDLALLESGCPAVMVGNAEEGLKQRLQPSETVFHAQGEGCDGIVEALEHFGVELRA